MHIYDLYSTDSEEEEEDVQQLMQDQLQRKVKRYVSERGGTLEYTRFIPKLMKEYTPSDLVFTETFGIYKHEFRELYRMIRGKLKQNHTRFHDDISNRDRLAICLRFLATGESMFSIGEHYHIPQGTLLVILRDVCKVISSHLMPIVMKKPTKDMWKKNAEEFKNRFSMPNCIGAIEGKNLYLGKQKLVFLALVDTKDRFIMVDVGKYRKQMYQGNVMDSSKIGKQFMNNELSVPENQPLTENSEPLPFVILGSSLFPAKPYLLTKYSKAECFVNEANKIFNTRLSRAKMTANSALLRLRNRWLVFDSPLSGTPKFVENIVQTCCCLHNLFGLRMFHPFRIRNPDTISEISDAQISMIQSLVPAESLDIRDKFKKYFLSPEGQVPWQWEYITN